MVDEFGEEVTGKEVKEKKGWDIRKFYNNRFRNQEARQEAYAKIEAGEKSTMDAELVNPRWASVIRGDSSKIIKKPDNYDKLSEREKLSFDKKIFLMDRNANRIKWLGRKGSAGYNELWKGEAPEGEKAGRIGGALMKVGAHNPLRYQGRQKLGRGGLNKAKAGIMNASGAMGEIGGAFGKAGAQSFQPIRIFTMAWKRMSVTMKWLVILVFLVVILFVPWGVFYYTGWAVGAAFMFLVSLIYWGFASFFNAIAYVLVTAINAVASIMMGVIIWIVEFFMSIFMKPNYVNPSKVVAGQPGSGYEYYWVAGHDLFDSALLRYSDVATVPTLMVPITPKWQPWMNDILIVKAFELIPGLQPIADACTVIGKAMGSAFENIITHSSPWVVIVIGLLPIIIVVAIGVVVYKKYSSEAQVL